MHLMRETAQQIESMHARALDSEYRDDDSILRKAGTLLRLGAEAMTDLTERALRRRWLP